MSIQHFAALSKKRRKEFLSNPQNFIAQEKLDGSNFIIGCTDGKIWTSRKTGKDKYFTPEDWGYEYWTSHFREAHVAATHDSASLICKFGENFELDCELISSYYPNTIEYRDQQFASFNGYSNMGVIFVYHSSTGSVGSLTNIARIGIGDIPFTLDGISTEYKFHVSYWNIASLDEIPSIRWEFYIREAAKLPEDEQEQYLLDNIPNKIQSCFGGGRVEGIVFKHKTEGWSLKLVDRSWFTALNQANYQVRKRLFKTPGQKTDSVSDVYARNIASGMPEKQAKDIAYRRTSELLVEYVTGPMANTISLHRRNLEAFAALHKQFAKDS